MIPKLDISSPELFLRCFYIPRIHGPKENMDAAIKTFKDFFQEHGEIILAEIEKLSGFQWTKDRIPVYLIPNSFVSPPYSFCKDPIEDDLPGVIQKVDVSGLTQQAWVHIHELVHVNQHQSEFYNLHGLTRERKKNIDLAELGADIITIYIVKKLFGENSEYEKDFWNFLQNTSEKNKRKYDILIKYIENWDLNNNNLRYYLEQNNSILENLL